MPTSPTFRFHPFVGEDGGPCAVCRRGPTAAIHSRHRLPETTAECAECEVTFVASALHDGVCTACQPFDMVPGFQRGDGVHRQEELRRCVICGISRALCRRIPGGTRSRGNYLCIPCESSLATMRPTVLEGLLEEGRIEVEEPPRLRTRCGCGEPDCPDTINAEAL